MLFGTKALHSGVGQRAIKQSGPSSIENSRNCLQHPLQNRWPQDVPQSSSSSLSSKQIPHVRESAGAFGGSTIPAACRIASFSPNQRSFTRLQSLNIASSPSVLPSFVPNRLPSKVPQRNVPSAQAKQRVRLVLSHRKDGTDRLDGFLLPELQHIHGKRHVRDLSKVSVSKIRSRKEDVPIPNPRSRHGPPPTWNLAPRCPGRCPRRGTPRFRSFLPIRKRIHPNRHPSCPSRREEGETKEQRTQGDKAFPRTSVS